MTRNPHVDSVTARMLDANFNRAGEALRVMEDYARLGLNDAGISEFAKRLRHTLSQLARSAFADALIRSRDIVGDVGTRIETESEYQRTDLRAAVSAAGRRLAEALRVIEECCKTLDPTTARQIEQVRYEGYELERRLMLTRQAVDRFGHVRLYVILTESECAGDWFETAREAIDGGADCIQLREKELPDRELLARARRLRGLCQDRGVLFAMNDRADIAVLCQAHVLHVGQDDLPIAEVRRVCGPDMLIGLSTHSLSQVSAAAEQAPDYIALGPIFSTSLKPASQPLGPNVVREAATRSAIPIVPIGGIDMVGTEALASAGARCVCVCRAVIGAADVTAAARSLREAIGSDAGDM